MRELYLSSYVFEIFRQASQGRMEQGSDHPVRHRDAERLGYESEDVRFEFAIAVQLCR